MEDHSIKKPTDFSDEERALYAILKEEAKDTASFLEFSCILLYLTDKGFGHLTVQTLRDLVLSVLPDIKS